SSSPPPCPSSGVSEWETQYRPFKFPQDLQRFLNVSNGVSIEWFGRGSRSMGGIHINGISEMTPIEFAPMERVPLTAKLPRYT
ncbi:hypothetical protein KIPB_014615, partial [Kipferlia bialata]